MDCPAKIVGNGEDIDVDTAGILVCSTCCEAGAAIVDDFEGVLTCNADTGT